MTNKGKLISEEGTSDLRTAAQPYVELGTDYQHIIKNNFYFLTGFHVTGGGRNITLDAQISSRVLPSFNGHYLRKYNQFDVGILLPVLIEKYWIHSLYSGFYVHGALQLHYSLRNDFDNYSEVLIDSANNFLKILRADLNSNKNRKPWITCTFSGGHHWKLKNGNSLKVGLQTDLSFTQFVQGSYTIDLPDNAITRSTYQVSGTYMALWLGYGLTKKHSYLMKAE